MTRLLWVLAYLFRSKSDMEAAKQVCAVVLGTLTTQERLYLLRSLYDEFIEKKARNANPVATHSDFSGRVH